MSETITDSQKSYKSAYWAWFLVALFYLYQYVLRVSPGVMIEELRSAFQLNANQFSAFGSYYMYAYALIQIPLGILVDQFGVKRTVLLSILLCIGGTVLMGITDSFMIAKMSRILIGFGSACAFMCALKIAADRLPPGRRGLLMGGTLTLGTLGALSAGKPLVYLVDWFGWRQTILLSAGFGLVILFLVFFFLPRKDPHKSIFDNPLEEPHPNFLTQLKEVFLNKNILLYAFLAVGLYTPLSVLADLWGPGFIKEKFGLSRADAAQTSMLIYLGMAIGSPVLTWISERYRVLNRVIRLACLGLLTLCATLLYGPVFGILPLQAIVIGMGFFSGAEMCCFSGAATFAHPRNSGITIGFVNTLNMLFAAILQKLTGVIMHYNWDGSVNDNGLPIYSSTNYISGLTSLAVIVTVSLIIGLFLKHKHPVASEVGP